MEHISPRQQKILRHFLEHVSLKSSAVREALVHAGEDISLPTVKRELSGMAKAGLLVSEGLGRSAGYRVSIKGRVLADIDAAQYCSIEPDRRHGLQGYTFDLFASFPQALFSDEEIKRLEAATAHYKKNTSNISPVVEKKELERLVVELSWKSSRIEGNTYTLLDTEKLIMENTEAVGHTKEEAQMILNHKDAFRYVREERDQFVVLTRKSIEDVHALLVKDMGIGEGVRSGLVGVTGSRYRPLDNVHQVTEAVEALCGAVARAVSPYEKALIALAGIGYIQPFEDGNKRTSRLVGNAVLLAHALSPLSYRSVDENSYREAMLVFYELNAITPLKRIFIEQYEFAAQHYAVR